MVTCMFVCVCRTPLHAAAHSGSVAGVQLVLAQGAEVNAVDHSGCSALMVAADCGQTMAVGMSLKFLWSDRDQLNLLRLYLYNKTY